MRKRSRRLRLAAVVAAVRVFDDASQGVVLAVDLSETSAGTGGSSFGAGGKIPLIVQPATAIEAQPLVAGRSVFGDVRDFGAPDADVFAALRLGDRGIIRLPQSGSLVEGRVPIGAPPGTYEVVVRSGDLSASGPLEIIDSAEPLVWKPTDQDRWELVGFHGAGSIDLHYYLVVNVQGARTAIYRNTVPIVLSDFGAGLVDFVGDFTDICLVIEKPGSENTVRDEAALKAHCD